MDYNNGSGEKYFQPFTPTRLLLLVFILFMIASANVSAQVTEDQYTEDGVPEVLHKRAKWYSLRDNLTRTEKNRDTFDDSSSGFTILESGTARVQTTHTTYDTIYVHKGTSITLTLPSVTSSNTINQTAYLRWFNYLNDGTFEVKDHPNKVYDLLTPTFWAGLQWEDNDTKIVNPEGYGETCYRTKNGYVTGSLTGAFSVVYTMTFYYPSDTDYQSWYDEDSPDKFVVACDISSYTDFAEEYEEGGTAFGSTTDDEGNPTYYEPTLMGRVVFVLISIDAETTENTSHFLLSKDIYHGGTNTGDERYLEEYEISFPYYHISQNTKELVALSESAESYLVPGESAGNTVTLNASIDGNDNSINIFLVTTSITGSSRIIQFNKSDWWDGVPDGSTATILVTRNYNGTTYNIARYKLTFYKESSPMTQHQINLIDGVSNLNTWWGIQDFRKPAYINANYDLLTERDFDYDISLAKTYEYKIYKTQAADPDAKIRMYPYPLDWTYSNYFFFDGSMNKYGDFQTVHNDYTAHTDNATMYNEISPQNETYCITADLCCQKEVDGTIPAVGDPTLEKDESTFSLYIDASDNQGTIVELPFEENLCQGTELIVTAWMKSAGDKGADDAAVLFTIVGVNADGTEDVLYRHCSGQIETTCWFSDNSQTQGIGSGTNDWFQIYFSFTIDEAHDYESYLLRIDNYCASTDGGDFYLDEIKVFVKHPYVNVEQLQAACKSEEDAQTPIRVDLDYTGLMARLLKTESDYTSESTDYGNVEFIIINKSIYDQYLNEHEPDEDQNETDEDVKVAAIKASIVNVSYGTGDNEVTTPNPGFSFYYYYKKNTEYDVSDIGSNYPTDGYWLRRTNEDSENEELSADFYATISPYTPYLIVVHCTDKSLSDVNGEEISDDELKTFAELIYTGCSIEEEFYVVSSTVIKIDGEIADPTTGVCEGHSVNLASYLTYEDGDETKEMTGVYFDWFFGTEEEYITPPEGYDVSLFTALTHFRKDHSEASELVEPEATDTYFTKDDYDVINYWLTTKRTDGWDFYLILYQTEMSITVPATGIAIVVQPISNEDVEKKEASVCLGYVPFVIEADGVAPSLNFGFSNVEYPSSLIPSLRMGLDQINSASSPENAITINLRDASYVSSDSDTDHLGLVAKSTENEGESTENNEDNTEESVKYINELYITGTNDESFTSYDTPVGYIAKLYADDYNGSDDLTICESSYMQIYFDTENFQPKEGYQYTMPVKFEEKDVEGNSIPSSCYGTISLTIKVVPEYLVWQGKDGTDNWNDDANWKRASIEQLKKPSGDSYPDNGETQTADGYIPMLFSKVVMPKDSKAELYTYGFEEDYNNIYRWIEENEESKRSENIASPAENVMYDLMVFDNGESSTDSEDGTTPPRFTTERYRVNLCDQIHFEPGAELLYSEQLVYNKAWVDVSVTPSTWTLVSLPLKDVVAGDWYVKGKVAEEATELFQPMKFDEDTDSRYNPLVYQRSWNSSSAVIITEADGTTGTDVPSYESTGWSSVYNDTYVPFEPGSGFSIKAYMSSGSTSDNIVFRFPKDDTSYSYSSSSDNINRTDAGLLFVSDLVKRQKPDDDSGNVYADGAEELSLGLNPDKEGYCLIGNPFTASLSMKTLLYANDEILEDEYWLGDDYHYSSSAGNKKFTSDGTKDNLLPPYGAAFVQIVSNSDESKSADDLKVKFTKDMQALSSDEDDAKNIIAFSVRAQNENGRSSAAFAYSDTASDGYDSNEDVILLEDDSWTKKGKPMVYTVAGDKAVSVNSLNSLTVIPLGVFVSDNSSYTLTFVGVDNVDQPMLYDAQTNILTPITEGFTVAMEGSSHGRYFIHTASNMTSGITETVEEDYGMTAFSPTSRTIVVSSNAELRNVEVYSVGGTLQKRLDIPANTLATTIHGVDSGVAIVKAKTEKGNYVRKIMVK